MDYHCRSHRRGITAFLALSLALLACANPIPPLPGSSPGTGVPDVPSAPATAPAATATNTPRYTLRVEAQDLTIRLGPGEIYEVVSPLNGLAPYFHQGEEIWLISDGNPSCVADDSGNLWIHAGSDRGLSGWVAAWYEGKFLVYPLPPECK